MARNSIGTYLMVKDDTDYKKLVDIKSAPSMDPAKELLDASTLSDHLQKMIEGRMQTSDGFVFTSNYDAQDYKTLKETYEGKENDYAVWIGDVLADDGTFTPTGSDGKFSFKATLSVALNDIADNSVMEMTETLLPITLPVFSLD